MSKTIKFSITVALASLLFVAVFALGFFVRPDAVSAADAKYIYVTPTAQNSDVAAVSTLAFCKADGTVMFYIPESYYVRYDGEHAPFGTVVYYKVSYMGFEGVVRPDVDVSKASSQSAVDSSVKITEQNAYPDVTLTAKNGTIVQGGVTYSQFLYVGEYENTVYAKVPGSDVPVAFDKSEFNAFSVPSHSEVLALIAGAGDSGAKAPANTDTSKVLRIILIIGIIVPALLIALLLFIPKKGEQYDKARMRSKGDNTPYDKDRSIDDARRPEREKYNRNESERRSREDEFNRDGNYYDRSRGVKDYSPDDDRRDLANDGRGYADDNRGSYADNRGYASDGYSRQDERDMRPRSRRDDGYDDYRR